MSIRKPQNQIEEKRMKEVDPYINMLSQIVNAYETTEFKGELVKTIKLPKRNIILAAIFLDDDNIATLVHERENINFVIYSRLTYELITTTLICNTSGQCISGEMIITPKKNLLIKYTVGPVTKHINYCSQKGEILWKESYESPINYTILNDDTIVLKYFASIRLLNDGKRRIMVFPDEDLPDHPSYSCNYLINPYGEKGYIYCSSKTVCIYDDSLERKELPKLRNKNIIALEVVDSNTIIFGTKDGKIIIYNIKEEKNININLSEYREVTAIKILPQKRCLVFITYLFSYDTIMILNLNNPENPIEKVYHGVNRWANYIGITSSGDVMFSMKLEQIMAVVYNISTKQDVKYKIGKSNYITSLSSFDGVIIKSEYKTTQIEIWE